MSFFSKATVTWASLGIASLKFPPFKSEIKKLTFSLKRFKRLASKTFAFALPLCISSPECPPLKPEILI